MPDNYVELIYGQLFVLVGAAVRFAVAWLAHKSRGFEEKEDEA